MSSSSSYSSSSSSGTEEGSSAAESGPTQLDFTDTLGGYDRWAPSYDLEQNPAIALTSWILDRSPLGCAGLEVLELGCGTGRNARRALAEGASSYTGVDGSAGMLAVARAQLEDARATWLSADLLAPWAPPRAFDLALMVLVLEHLPDLAAVATTMARALRAGGRLRIVDLHHDRLAAGSIAQFQHGGGEVRFASTAHPLESLRAALAPHFDIELREHAATDELVDAIPKLAKQRGRFVGIDVHGVRRG